MEPGAQNKSIAQGCTGASLQYIALKTGCLPEINAEGPFLHIVCAVPLVGRICLTVNLKCEV